MRPPGWLVGSAIVTVTLIILGMGVGLFASGGGIAIAAAVAFWAGAGAAALIDPDRGSRNAGIVAFCVVVLLAAYLMELQSRPVPPGSQGGPNVMPPPGTSLAPPSRGTRGYNSEP